MTSTIYQRFTYWFAPLLFSVFVLSYQNCSDVGFKRIGGDEGPGGEGLACLPSDFDLQMSTTTVALNTPVTFSVNPPAVNTTYTWELNTVNVGTGTSNTQTFTADGTYSMRVTAMKNGCDNPRFKTVTFTIESAPVCNLNALALTGDSWGRVDEMLDYIVNHNCLDLTFGWNAGDGTVVTNTDNEMSHDWDWAGIFVVSTDVSSGSAQQRLSMPVTIQDSCPALGDLFVSAPDVAYVNDVVPFDIIIPGCLNIASINWSFGVDSNPSTSNVKQTQTTYSSPGVRNVTAVVTDSDGNSVTLPHRITILSSSVPPCDEEALLTLTGPTVGNVNESLRFGVYVPSCIQATAYTWNFGDTSGGSGNPVNKSYAAAGIYTVSVIVSTVDHGFITLSRRVVIHAPLTTCTVRVGGSVVGTIATGAQVTRWRRAVSSSSCATRCQSLTLTCTTPGNLDFDAAYVSTSQASCEAANPCADGACKSPPNGGSYSTPPAGGNGNLCSPGSASAVTTNSNSYTWTCASTNGGSTASCSATRIMSCPAGYHLNPTNDVCVQWRYTANGCSSNACGVNGTTTYTSSCVNTSGAQVTGCNPSLNQPPQGVSCSPNPNTCTCTPPRVNVGGACVIQTNGACLSPHPSPRVLTVNQAMPADNCQSGSASPNYTSVPAGGQVTFSCLGSNSGATANNCRIQRHECSIGTTRPCSVSNGSGTQRCDTGYWGACEPVSCGCGYSLVNGSCQNIPATNVFNPGPGNDGVDRVRETQWIAGLNLTPAAATSQLGAHPSAWQVQPSPPECPTVNVYHRNRQCESGFDLINTGGISNGCLRSGSCGGASGGTHSNLTSTSPGLCGVGQVLSFNATSTGWTWSCRYENWNWGASSCSATRAVQSVNASCGSNQQGYAHQGFTIAGSVPAGIFCATGTAPYMPPPSLFAPNYRSEWTCLGIGGGNNASCVAYGYNVGNCSSTFGACIDGTPGNLNSAAGTWTCKGAKGPTNPELPLSHPGYPQHVRQCAL
jgi:hypothetical protein